MQDEMMESLKPRPLNASYGSDEADPHTVAHSSLLPPTNLGTDSPLPRPRSPPGHIRPAASERRADSPVRVTVDSAKATYYPLVAASGGAGAWTPPRPERNTTPPPQRRDDPSPWEQRKNTTIVELSRRLAAGSPGKKTSPSRESGTAVEKSSPLRRIENLPGRLTPELAPGANKSASPSQLPPDLALGYAGRAIRSPVRVSVDRAKVSYYPDDELLVDAPLLGVPPSQFVRATPRVAATPLPPNYMPGNGFDRARHLDPDACELPPTLTEEERGIARAVQRAKSKPQVNQHGHELYMLFRGLP
uniref:Uncharacterized protein n=1 Tax=Tetraselmis chuii TaxID=63592 RepID=A0A7S1X0W6_9CHLO|mmetsp:Transcript_19294/g.34402  ORF Transcript_19294/g.34402 Transcript_19294/m.34402 type:complete len:304 (+) Transcript_19294:248-1159(+)